MKMKLDILHMKGYCEYNNFILTKQSNMRNIITFNQHIKEEMTFGMNIIQHFYYNYL